MMVLAGAFALAGCAGGTLPFRIPGADAPDAAAGAPTAPARQARGAGADVEAPEVFQLAAEGLWDGRPSLGGVWVASADARDPERVIIRNRENGMSVIGALFRRERENPGPPIQISSDAAEALGLLAGRPAEISITALRRDNAAPKAAEDPADPTEPPAQTTEAAAATGEAQPAPEMTLPDLSAAAPRAKPGASLIQLGFFSVEANADQAAKLVTDAGAPATVRQEESKGQTYWSVVAGPAANPAGREALLQKVRSLGFTDAYVIPR